MIRHNLGHSNPKVPLKLITEMELRQCLPPKLKNEEKNIRLLVFSISSIDLAFFDVFCFVFYVVCKISNFNNVKSQAGARISSTPKMLKNQIIDRFTACDFTVCDCELQSI